MRGNSSWREVRSAIVGVIVGGLLVMSFPVAAAVGDALKLGQVNAADARTTLTGATTANLRVVNTQAGGVAIDLRVQAGAAPLKVNSTTRVVKLNADLLDGKHASYFATAAHTHTGPSYYMNMEGATWLPGETRYADSSCNPGDAVLGGGYSQVSDDILVFSSHPTPDGPGWTPSAWRVEATNTFTISLGMLVYVMCAHAA